MRMPLCLHSLEHVSDSAAIIESRLPLQPPALKKTAKPLKKTAKCCS
jgi:hypothetical protein